MHPQAIQAILQSLVGMKQTIATIEQLLVQSAAGQPQYVPPQVPFQQSGMPQQFAPHPQQFQQQAPAYPARPIQPVPDFGGQYLNQAEEAALDVAMGVNDPQLAQRAEQMRAKFLEQAMSNPNSLAALRAGGFAP